MVVSQAGASSQHETGVKIFETFKVRIADPLEGELAVITCGLCPPSTWWSCTA